MAVLILSLALFGIAFLVQVIMWRIYLPKNHSAMLGLIFLIILGFGLFVLAVFNFFGFSSQWVWIQKAQLILLFLCLAIAYIISYSAVEAQSPSIEMVIRIARAGSAGLSRDELAARMSDEKLVLPRLKELLDSKMAILKDAKYRLTPLGRNFIMAFVAYGNLLGKKQKGG